MIPASNEECDININHFSKERDNGLNRRRDCRDNERNNNQGNSGGNNSGGGGGDDPNDPNDPNDPRGKKKNNPFYKNKKKSKDKDDNGDVQKGAKKVGFFRRL
jgi:hypothetical protein